MKKLIGGMDLHTLAFVNFTNCNKKRFLFYKLIYEYFYKDINKIITRDTLIEYGKLSGLSVKQTEDEIIGCLYAPFLLTYSYDSKVYKMSYNGLLRFSEFFTNGNYVEYEIPLTILFSEKDIRFRRIITDTLSEIELKYFMMKGWSRNKSEHRLTKKVKNLFDYKIVIQDVISSLQPIKKMQIDYLYLIDKYGWNYRLGDNRGCNLHSRFMLKSTLIEEYKLFLGELLELTHMPIDWGGRPIKANDFILMFNKYKHLYGENSLIISDCITDGLIRYSDHDSLSLTSTGYTTIKTYLSDFKTIQLYIKKIDTQYYNIEIGVNNTFLREFFSELEQDGFIKNDGWYEKKLSESGILSFFDRLYWSMNQIKI